MHRWDGGERKDAKERIGCDCTYKLHQVITLRVTSRYTSPPRLRIRARFSNLDGPTDRSSPLTPRTKAPPNLSRILQVHQISPGRTEEGRWGSLGISVLHVQHALEGDGSDTVPSSSLKREVARRDASNYLAAGRQDSSLRERFVSTNHLEDQGKTHRWLFIRLLRRRDSPRPLLFLLREQLVDQ